MINMTASSATHAQNTTAAPFACLARLGAGRLWDWPRVGLMVGAVWRRLAGGCPYVLAADRDRPGWGFLAGCWVRGGYAAPRWYARLAGVLCVGGSTRRLAAAPRVCITSHPILM
jgi:hypothetical protein